MQSKFKLFASLLLVFSLSFSFLLLFSKGSDAQSVVRANKVTICHSTNSYKNPYTVNTVDDDAIFKQGHDEHIGDVWYEGIDKHSWGDIIPPFTYNIKCPSDISEYTPEKCSDINNICTHGSGKCAAPIQGFYEGLNWNEKGRAIWENDCEVEIKEKEMHNLTLTSMCYNPRKEIRVWRVFHDDSNDRFYPITLGYQIYSGAVVQLPTLFTFNHTRDARFADPYNFNTLYDGNSQTVILYWWDDFSNKWVKDDTKASNKELCADECDSTIRVYGEWSNWMVDPLDESMEYMEREVSAVAASDNEILCAGPVMQKEPRDRAICEWDEELYYNDPECVKPNGDGEGDDDDGDTMGVDDEKDVKGATTSVVLAATAAGDNTIVYLVQSILLLLSGVSLMYVGREYLNRN